MSEAGNILDQVAPQPLPPVGGAPTDGTTPPVIEEKISPKLELLMRREQAALERERVAKRQEMELKEKLERIRAFDEVKTNPKKALEFLGLSYDQLTQSMLSDGEVPPQVEIQRLRDELEKFKNSQNELRTKEEEDKKRNQEERERQVISDFQGEIKQFIEDNKARYELIEFEQAHGLIFDVIDEHYKRTINPATGAGKVMSINEASDKVEQYLEKKYVDSRGLNKIKAMWNSLPQAARASLAEQVKPQAPQAQKTLTNTLAPPAMKPVVRPSEDQRISQIVAAFRAQKGI